MENKADPRKSSNESVLAQDAQDEVIRPEDFLRTVKSLVRSGKNRDALYKVMDAAMEYPDDPFILSYHGLLTALVDRKYRAGVDKCKLALSMIQKDSKFGEGRTYPEFYLNLGKAYLAAGKKKEALEFFNGGLKYDKRNRELLQELRALGSRKKAVVPFLDRSNPINKLVGRILHSAKKNTDKKK